MPLTGLEHTISAGVRPQTYVLDLAATGTGGSYSNSCKLYTTVSSIRMLVAKGTNDRNLTLIVLMWRIG